MISGGKTHNPSTVPVKATQSASMGEKLRPSRSWVKQPDPKLPQPLEIGA
jgi:hypothetical protein